MSEKQTILTGLQPSGDLHIGNYFGALKPFVDAQRELGAGNESFIMVADYHSLTSLRNPDELRRNVTEIVKSYIAAGVDPEKATIFRQSDVPEHTELAWVFDCVVTVPFLQQAHAYKDKVAKGLEANAGLFTYPMLMAADILLYDTDVVPVGEDQRQHVEYAREAATKFNKAYGELFKKPKELILPAVGIVPGTDGAKMSKSYGNTVPLFASRDAVAKAVMGIVTDSGGGRPENVYAIHKLIKDEASLDALYREHEGKYKALKEALIEDLDVYFTPLREKYESLTDADVAEVLERSAVVARERAGIKMEAVRKAVGVR
ncbi:MAG TPA: tryptophan--tRNA ligase [Candidatus Paceibacterota bacterium]|jgi:tryptophanyl-tRNA synthetase